MLRKRKRDGGAFLGCITWPLCDFVEPFNEIANDLMHQRDELTPNEESLKRSHRLALMETELRRHMDEKLQLQIELSQLRTQYLVLQAELGGRQRNGSVDPTDLSRRLKGIIAAAHPDKWQDHPLSVEIVKQLNDLRSSLYRRLENKLEI